MSFTGKKIVIVGAGSSIAEHCARRWAAQSPSEIVLAGRDAGRIEHIAQDLRVRAPFAAVRIVQGDLLAPDRVEAMIDEIHRDGPVDLALIAHGALPDQLECQRSLRATSETILVNGLSPVLFAEAFAGRMQQAGRGTLAIVGSVAGDRGRKSNYTYGAAKGLVARHAQGLQHRLVGSGVSVVLVKPGPTDTPMTSHLKRQGARLAPVEQVADDIVRGIARRKRVVYAPGRWAVVMQVMRHLPDFVFNRMDI